MIWALINLFIFFNLLFLWSLYLKDNSIVDVGWGIGFVIICLSLLLQHHSYSHKQIAISALIILWATRLSSYIFLRNKGKGEDFRYANWRKAWGANVIWRSYLQVFLLQMLFLIIIATPIFATFNNAATLTNINITGLIIAVSGFLFEAISDLQMMNFKKKEENKGKIMRYGLWRYSRHPNYFGEAVFWWAIAFAAHTQSQLIVFISPVVITFLLCRVSGVPMLEAKYKHHPEFQEYIRQTSAFVPWPPSSTPKKD